MKNKTVARVVSRPCPPSGFMLTVTDVVAANVIRDDAHYWAPIHIEVSRWLTLEEARLLGEELKALCKTKDNGASKKYWLANQPCEHEDHWVDHSEFGLPLGCTHRCAECGALW